MDRDTTPWLIPLVLAAGVGAAVWYYWLNIAHQEAYQPATQMPMPQTVPQPQGHTGPRHPISPAEFSGGAKPDLRPLPPLNDSDEYFKLELTDLFGDPIGILISGSRIIERVVATVDSLPRRHVAERIRPVTGLADAFVAESEGGNLYSISEESYRRFDPLCAIIEKSDVRDLADLYRRYYMLFQKAYVELGYPSGYFNDRLVEAIDNMLATPELSGPVLLVRPHVLYEFESPVHEARSSGQKLMLRMGSENAAKVKAKLQDLRDAITGEQVQK